ncbi:hypothetical protein INS49_014262 [Diaporthe citri]|uniref:uncharacterized protein n=1 Tax=Diaporthe citri TaxID=83186 RepID=UPI001C7E6538|nr:uncharacterized protein INS49_014262 [Diaporthe citri]KAG6358378.1 hypothetical protein INS49_014262 [Diaporthe citri]
MSYTGTGPEGRTVSSVTTVEPPDQLAGQDNSEATSSIEQAEGNVSLRNHANNPSHFQQIEGRLDIGQVQVLIICAKDLEVDAVLATLDKRYKKKTIVKHVYLFSGTFKDINVAILPLLQKGMVSSTTDTSQVASDMRPDAYIISAGICGGTGYDDDKKQPVHLGDVVISTDVARYFDRVQGKELVQKMVDQKFGGHQRLQRQINILKMGDDLFQLRRDADENLREVRSRISSGFFSVGSFQSLSASPPDGRIHQDRLYKEKRPHMHQEPGCNDLPSNWLERGPPTERGPLPVHFGIYGSEDVVMRSGNYTRTLLKERGIMAVDMESRGIWHAAGSHIPRDVVIIRGVSDYADSHKNDAWQPYAAMASACTIKAFVVNFFESME